MTHFWSHTHSKRNIRGTSVLEKAPSTVVGMPPVLPITAELGRKPPSREAIAKLAYSYWEARGRQGGLEKEDWFRAERELQERS